jgi:hypothetical protein
MVAEAFNYGTTWIQNQMKLIIPEMDVVPEMHILGSTWQLNPEIAPFPESAATEPPTRGEGLPISCSQP